MVAVTAALTVVGVDLFVRALVPFPPPLREVEDALAEYRAGDPTVLLLGSSHARTFTTLGELLRERTGGKERVQDVPLEFGKLSSYEWLLEHRLRPLIEERDAAGALVRPSLRRFVLVTEWWDSCPTEGPASNLPARAWDFADFVRDVADKGLTGYNGNYLSNRWTRLLVGSVLVRDRGHERIKEGLRALVAELSPAVTQAAFDRRVSEWHRNLEEGVVCVASASEMAAFQRIVEYFQGRGVEVTVVLYPRMPVTLTEKAKATTLRAFSEKAAALARSLGVRVVDLTLDHPLTDDDFEPDFDHITADGNRKFGAWAIEGPLAFLATPLSGSTPQPVAQQGGSR